MTLFPITFISTLLPFVLLLLELHVRLCDDFLAFPLLKCVLFDEKPGFLCFFSVHGVITYS